MNNENLRYDILKELFNISVGKAASLLSEIINRRILLTVPNVETFNLNNKEFLLDNYLPKEIDGALMVSSISFHENLKGKANLIFPAQKMRTFINLCVNEDNSEMNFTDIDFDIIKEIGNIILNSIVGEIGNYLDLSLDYTLPEVKVYSRPSFSKNIEEDNEYTHLLILFITFVIDETEIEGVIVVNLTLSSLNELMKNIDRIEKKLYE
ncbi:MAG: chemotaxis protein CheC [Herbinix sp.]|nr:chemotaxis protein CheC [Herbinix sp.]